jgi:predicted HTH transcriptional regulator
MSYNKADMNYFVLIVVALAGIALGMYIARRKANVGFIDKQMEQKAENKQKILAFVQEHGKIQNNDVEKLVGVSNATAERYLDELEKEDKLTQRGTIGQGVFYTLK